MQVSVRYNIISVNMVNNNYAASVNNKKINK